VCAPPCSRRCRLCLCHRAYTICPTGSDSYQARWFSPDSLPDGRFHNKVYKRLSSAVACCSLRTFVAIFVCQGFTCSCKLPCMSSCKSFAMNGITLIVLLEPLFISARHLYMVLAGASLGRLGPSGVQGRCRQLPCSTGQRIETRVFQFLCKTRPRPRADPTFSKSPCGLSKVSNLIPLWHRQLVPHKVPHIPLCPPHCLNSPVWAVHRLQPYRLPLSPAQMKILLVLPSTQLPRIAPLTQS